MDNISDMVRKAIRVKSSASDEEINDLIAAAKGDLALAGVYISDSNIDDPLVRQAIKLYAKANFGYDEKTDRFQNAFDKLKDSMALSGEYEKAV